MQDILSLLRNRGIEQMLPATEKEIRSAERKLDCSLPDEVYQLYLDHDGEARHRALPFRQLTLEEAIEFHAAARESEMLDFERYEARYFWTDDNSNYAGVFVSGPMQDMVTFADHENINPDPVFRNTRNFLNAMLNSPADADWTELQAEVPELQPGTPRQRASDLATREVLLDMLLSAPEEEILRLKSAVITLTPFDLTAEILPYLSDEDMFVQEDACKLLGKRRFMPALDALFQVAQAGKHNARIAAMLALGQLKGPESLDRLLALRKTAGEGLAPYLAMALRASGCETTHDRGIWFFRTSSDGPWQPLTP